MFEVGRLGWRMVWVVLGGCCLGGHGEVFGVAGGGLDVGLGIALELMLDRHKRLAGNNARGVPWYGTHSF